MIWSVLLRRFELTLARRGHAPDYSTFVVGPRRPCVVRYRRRRAGAPAPPGAAGERGREAPPAFEEARTCASKSARPGSTPTTGTPWSTRGRCGRGDGGHAVLGRADRRLPRRRRPAARARGPVRSPAAPAVARRGHRLQLTCAYHGWSYGEDGALAGIPHDRCGRPMPSLRIRAYPPALRPRLGLPGRPRRAAAGRCPRCRSSRGPRPWAYVPIDFTWRAHHSMVIDNLCDLTHAHLHRRFTSFQPGRLLASEAERRPRAAALRGAGGPAGPRRRRPGRATEICYEYPYHWARVRVVWHRGPDQVLDVPAAAGRATTTRCSS